MSGINRKQNAKEYLKAFAASQDNWLKALIYNAIETNGEIPEEKKDEIFQHLSIGTELSTSEPNINNENSDTEIKLIKLNHIQGVNALRENQIIKFNKDITILYGLNGAGKSSYFKVLNEIVGGNQKKDILSNIYSEVTVPIEIELNFEEKGKQPQTILWNGSNRSLNLLNRCKVFDTSYLNGLLATRKADATLIQPLGLNLFAYLVGLIDGFKDKLNSEAEKKRLTKPTLEFKYIRDNIKISFENHQVNKDAKKQVEDLYGFSDEDSKKLTKTKNELSGLKQNNIQDKIKLKSNDKGDLETVTNYIKDTHKSISSFMKKTHEALKEFLANKEANKLTKEQFSILSNIPGNDTEEWKEFIKAGEKYTSKIENNEDVCVYCRQPLKNEISINLIKEYGSFLNDESEQKLNNSIEHIDSLIKQIDRISIEMEIKENIEAILKEEKIEDTNESIFQIVTNIKNDFTSRKKLLLEKIKKRDIETKIVLSNVDNILEKLILMTDNIQAEIDNLSEEHSKKNERIEKLQKIQNQLLENKSINEQIDKFTTWFEINDIENKSRKKASKINTRQISDLSKKAHNDLLTETLKINFTDELKGLGHTNLDVQIENARGQKGVSNTKITLTKNNDIKAVLSEGEQKAVALALFIAEAKIQKSNNPIILDDPVNSLDHKIASSFADRLLKLDNQIILFNHNKLFLDAFETSKGNHICKAIDSDCSKSKGKHIRVYLVNSEGKNAKGVLSNYKSNKSQNHIKESKTLLRNTPFDEEIKVASLIRKAVECTIDEVIFNNQVPTKHSNKNSRIAWVELKKLNNDNSVIETLERIHGRVSGGGMHNGTENEENPIEVGEFNTMILEIEALNKREES